MNPCFTLMYSMTCKHVYWYEYQFCTSRAKTTVRSQFTMERQQTTWHGFCAPPKPDCSPSRVSFENGKIKARRRECLACLYHHSLSKKIKAQNIVSNFQIIYNNAQSLKGSNLVRQGKVEFPAFAEETCTSNERPMLSHTHTEKTTTKHPPHHLICRPVQVFV